MRRREVLALAAAVAVFATSRTAFADDAQVLVRKADHVLRGATTAAVLHMDVHTASYDRNYSLVYWEDMNRAGGSVLVRILGPALWRGYGTLKVGNRLSLYNPNTDRVTVLSSSMLGDSWMGSHFNNDDFVKGTDLANDYTSREVRSWSAKSGERTVAYHEIDLRPTPRAPVAWDHVLTTLYVDGGWVIPVRFDYFRRAADKTAYRTLAFTNVKTIGGRYAPSVLTMTVADKPGEYTRLTYDSARFDVPVPASKFTEQALRR